MRKGSLLRRILPPLAGAVALLTLIVVAVGVTVMRRAVLDRARQRAVGLSSVERDDLERLMRSDHGDLQNLVEKLARNPDLAAIRILRPDGTVHASSVPAEVGRQAGPHATQLRADGDLLSATLFPAGGAAVAVHTVQPFLNRTDCRTCHTGGAPIIGWLDLDVAVNPHLTGLTAFTSLSTLLGLLYLVAVVAVAAPVVALVVGRPVRRLMNAMEQVRAGDLSVVVPPTGTRELDEVVDGFNGMVERLRQARATEEEARRLELERVEQLASVGELAAGLAHEIRNPLSGVKAVMEVMARDTPDEGRRSVLREAVGELGRIDHIVRELLQYARPKKPVLSSFDLNRLVEDATGLLLPAREGTARIALDLAPDLPLALADAGQVRQVVVNLLLNAEHAAGPDGDIVVTTGTDGGVAWCRTRDSGPGVPVERAESIFRPFFTTRTRGTGLGLPISRRMIELQGGRLVLDNPGGAGASFTFSLPLAP